MTAMALEDLKPALWGTLSDELLHFVFLRLPVPEISQIRLLSKAWKSSIDSADSYLSRALEDTVYPNLFGLIDLDYLCARVLDAKRDQWYIRSIDPSFDGTLVVGAADGELDCSDSESAENFLSTMGAADGGLVCFDSETSSESVENSLSVVVMNPLTGKKVRLPDLLSMPNGRPTIKPSMVQLTMDRQTNQYKVLVAKYALRPNRGLFAQVYDSQTKQWSAVGSGEKSRGRILGYEYDWICMDDVSYSFEQRQGPCLYDFAKGQLHRFNGNKILQGIPDSCYALFGDRLFVLHAMRRAGPSNLIQSGQERNCYISEYHLSKNGTAWVKVETHGCNPFEDFPGENHRLSLHACNGFLMVIGQARVLDSDNVFVAPEKYEFVWLYNLSTSKWQVLPKVPGLHSGSASLDLMCELRWSARP